MRRITLTPEKPRPRGGGGQLACHEAAALVMDNKALSVLSGSVHASYWESAAANLLPY